MENIVKQNFLIHHFLTYIGVLVFIVLAILFNIPGSFTFLIALATIILSLFIYDKLSNANLFTLSLPVSKKNFVAGRYIFSIITMITILLIIWIWMNVISMTLLDLDGRYLYHWKDIIILFALGSGILATVLPVHYLLPFNFAATFLGVCYLLGTYFYITLMVNSLDRANADIILFNDLDAGLIILIEEKIPFAPYPILIISSIIILYLSMKLATFIVKRKDV